MTRLTFGWLLLSAGMSLVANYAPSVSAQETVFEPAPAGEAESPDSKQRGGAQDSSAPGQAQPPIGLVPVEPEQPAPPVQTAQPGESTRLDEIVVTAQRRTQSVLDVPISMTVINDKFLSEQGISDLTELSRYLPNTKIKTDLSAGQSINIRGFTRQSGVTTFEQAVGLLIDGVTFNDNDYFVMGLFDIERIEVLRGPQGTLLGKNTTGGLLNITTKSPTAEFTGAIEGQAGDFDRKGVEGAFGGPLIDGILNFRFAFNFDQRDGYMGNTTKEAIDGPPPSRLVTRDQRALRFKVEAPDLLGSKLGFIYEKAEAEFVGTGVEIVTISQRNEDFLREYDPDLDVTPDNFIGSVDFPGESQRNIEKFIGHWTHECTDWTVDAVAAYAVDQNAVTASDATPAPLLFTYIEQTKPQRSVEFITNTADLFGVFEFTGGVFYQSRPLPNIRDTLEIDGPVFTAWSQNQTSPVAIPAPPPSPTAARESTTMIFDQNSQSLAGYGQIGWPFAERWTLIGGLRVTQEKKDARWNRTLSDNAVILHNVNGYREYMDERSRDEVLILPKIALQYRPIREISLFAHYAQGARSGGFNSDATAPSPTGFTYEPEFLTEYAINAKTILFDGALRFNIGLFYNDLKDFQLATKGPADLTVVTVNAGQARAQGIESDLTWAATDWLSFIGTVGVNDAEFTDFKNGPCTRDRPNTDGDADPRCDLTGVTPPFIPKVTSSLTTSLGIPLAAVPLLGGFKSLSNNGVEIQLGFTAEYQDDQYTGLPGDERFTQAAFTRYAARFGIASTVQRWSFKVIGENLSDEAINRGRGLVNSSTVLVQQLETPRLIYGQFRWDF